MGARGAPYRHIRRVDPRRVDFALPDSLSARRLHVVEPKEMQEIAAFLRAAQPRLQSSLETSRALLTAEFAGPSFAWSVRSVEIFLKYFVLAPLYYESGSGGSGWTKAVKKASNKVWQQQLVGRDEGGREDVRAP